MMWFFNKKDADEGQAVIEFTFAIIVTVLFMHALIMAFKWSSLDLAERRISYDNTLTTPISENWFSVSQGPLRQFDDDFFQSDNNLSLIIGGAGGSGGPSDGADGDGTGSSGSGGNPGGGSGSSGGSDGPIDF